MQSSSHSLLSWPDGFATKSTDVLILLGRIAWVFVGVAYGTIINFAGSLSYFTSLKLPAPALFTWLALVLELVISAGLILGIGTRRRRSDVRVCGGCYCNRTSVLGVPGRPAADRPVQ
jgi:putative oxidoreductase